MLPIHPARPHPDRRIAGLLAPLFALRSADDLGIGDCFTLREFVDWAAEYGFRLIQLLPINETGGDNSPYMAVSSSALDPTTIRTSPEAIPDLSPADYKRITARAGLGKLRSGRVRYRKVKPLKLDLLAAAFEAFCKRDLAANSPRARKFKAFIKENAAWLPAYTLFRVLMERNGSEQWDRWPAHHASAAAARHWLAGLPAQERAAFHRREQFYTYIQWIAYSQWLDLRAHCDRLGIALMGDIPFGVSYYSDDVFSNPELFDLTWSGGAPPERVFKADPFTEKWGQNWGVPIYNWPAMRKDNFAWWRRRVHLVREVFHLFRVDHVLGFYRIYSFPWRPTENDSFLPLTQAQARARTGGRLPGFKPNEDATPAGRKANCRSGEEILRVLVKTVQENALIGEDLGVVPDYVRPSLTSLGIAGFKIPQWEIVPKASYQYIPGPQYQRLSVTTYATHDHPPMKTMWADLVKAAQAGNRKALRELKAFARYAGIATPVPTPYTPAIREALLAALLRGNAWLAIFMITDLLGSTQRFNVPGAIADTNWSTRLPQTVAQLRSSKAVRAIMERMRRLLEETGRIPS